MKYSKGAVKDWFHRTLGINQLQRDEVKTTCPKCGHESFYFNLSKHVGWCHHDKCHWAPSLEDLIDRIGYAPDEFGPTYTIKEEPEPLPVILPGVPVIFVDGSHQRMTYYPEVVNYLKGRGLSDYDILRFNLTYDGFRVYVPVYRDDELINYVGRDLTGTSSLKYKYCPGAKTSEWIFGWDESKYWPRLTLVENTFVSIALRAKAYCATNFGSYLSKAQIDLIRRSKVQSVALLWDENAHKSAAKAVKALRPVCPAAFVWMKGQPDDYPQETIVQIAKECHEAARAGQEWIDPFDVRLDALSKDF